MEQLEKSGPLKGIKVVEIGMWAAGPAAGGIFTDWGADVIKVEPLEGDPYRALVVQRDNEGQDSPQFRLDNRAKRSVTLDVRTDEGRKIAYELIKRADVFLTNIRLQSLERFKMTWDILKEVNPRLIYTIVTGYGIKGAEINRPAFDSGAWWGRGGVAATVLPDGIPPLFLAGGIGDHFTAMAAVTGTAAALFAREHTGKGQLVDVSMLRTAAYFISFNLFDQMLGRPRKKQQRHETLNPMIIPYQTKGGKWFSLLGLQGDRVWPLVMPRGGPSRTDRRRALQHRGQARPAQRRTGQAARRDLRHPSGGRVGAPVRPRRCMVGAGPDHRRPAQGSPGSRAPACSWTCRLPRARKSKWSPHRWTSAAPRGAPPERIQRWASTPRRCCWNSAMTGKKSRS